jgi:hypothetical protein
LFKKTQLIAPLLIFAIFLGGFIPVTQTKSTQIDAPFFNIYQQINSPANWLKWQPCLKITDRNNIKIDSSKLGFQIKSTSFEVDLERIGIAEFLVAETRAGKKYYINYILLPETNTNRTTCVAKIKTNVFYCLWAIIKSGNNARSSLFELKNYLENSRLYYGFLIEKKRAPDNLIAVKKGKFLAADKYHQGMLLYNYLNQYIKVNKLKLNGALQLQCISARQDSVVLMIGLPINKKAPISNGIEYMNMPGGKILVGHFRGEYNNKEKIYSAMQQYIIDNYLHALILPFEKFRNNKIPDDGNAIVDMQVVIPYL